ncbi:MAG TPA: DUF1937 family protein [Woeseiaceae bacterium]|nr:DUF1937 family protein [Woeseiaceae bacterium]
MSIIYLASPYTHSDPIVCDARYETITEIAAKLVLQKKIVFSPITMTHPYDRILAEPGNTLGSDYWVNFDIAFMDVCSEMYVATIPGWEDSSGIKREIEYFERQGKKVTYIGPADFDIDFADIRFRAAFDNSA